MNNTELLISQVELHPTNPIVAAMLVDELMESKDLTRAQADVQVQKVREVAIEAAFLRRASEIMAGCPWQRHWGRATVLEELGAPDDTTAVIMLVSGPQAPRLHVPTSMEHGALWHEGTITVGAEWVVREYREYIAWRNDHNREVRDAKKKK